MRSLLGKANQRNSPGVESINEERPSTNTSEGGQDQTEDFMRKISVGSGGRKFLGNEILGGTSSTSNSSPDKGKGSSTTSSSAGGQRPSLTTIPSEGSPTSDDEKSADVIDRGVIDINVAKMYLDHYRNEMVKHAPIVALRPEETFDVLRTVKPVLFLVILAAAAGQKDHAMYQILHEECLHVYAEKYILQSEKTLELVQCFLLTSVWLFPPDDFRALKFYQYVHMAAAMMLDIGHVAPRAPKEPESKPKPEAGVFQGCGDETSVFLNLIKKDDPLEEYATYLSELETMLTNYSMRSCYKSNTYRGEVAGKLENEIEVVESRRTYLACYLLCSKYVPPTIIQPIH